MPHKSIELALVRCEEAARLLGHPPATLRDSRWRRRVGLSVVKVGRAVCFRARDLADLVERGLEAPPGREDLERLLEPPAPDRAGDDR